MLIRPAEPGDLVALTDLYNHYVRHSNATFDLVPFSYDERRKGMSRYSATGPHRLLVGVEDGAVVGYACSSRLRDRAAYDRSAETSIYLRDGFAGRGLGRQLYERLFADLAGEGLHRAFAAIAVPNPASLALHQAMGYRRVGVWTEVGFKFGRYHDVEWWERPL